jgi:Ca-activated chloride channel family protein
MLVLDVSGSMRAIDFTIGEKRATRLMALQEEMNKFVSGRAGDRIGLVVFGSESYTLCPLTLDHQTVLRFIQQLEVGMAGTATAIGDGLLIGLKRLQAIDADSKVIILATDGKNNSPTVNPQDAAELAAKLGIRVHVVGIGGEGPAPFVEKSFFGTEHVVSRELEFDEPALQKIAATAGGEYFLARDSAGLERVYAAIDALEERKENNIEFVDYEEYFFPFLALGSVLLIVSELLSVTLFLRIP